MTDYDAIRQLLRGWGTYGPHFDDGGRLVGYWHTPLDIDAMTDDEVLRVAREIATQKEAA